MALLKDLLVNGASRLIGDAFVNKILITTISAPTSSGGTTYGPGTSGQVLKSNGTSIYWTSDNNSVTGVKGNSESSYRTGNVNITAGNIGLGNVENKSSATIRGELTSSNVTTALGFTPYNSTNPNGYTTNTGTVTKVTAGTGLAIGTTAQGNFTTTGTINHTNSVTAQTTQALYPIKIDACGHISAYGTAVTSLPASDVSAWAKAANKPSYAWSEITDKPSSFTPATHTHYELATIGDLRSTATTPNTYSNKFIFLGLKYNTTIALTTTSTPTYSYVVGLRGWTDSNGGNSHELAFNNVGLFYRNGASTTWGDWSQVITTANSDALVGIEIIRL